MVWVEEFSFGIVVGAAAAYGAWTAVRYLRSRGDVRSDPLAIPAGATGSYVADIPDSASAGFASDEGVRAGGPGRERPLLSGVANGPIADGGRSLPAAPHPSVGEDVRLSKRIVLHLFLLGRIGPDDVGHPGATQRGIGTVLQAEQSAVSKVLNRLAAAGVVEVGRRHVRGQDRRVNVYTLTRQGEALARDIRSRLSPGAGEVPRHLPSHRAVPAPTAIRAPDRR
jgi:DNA-binding MarR family transcriptional regulator